MDAHGANSQMLTGGASFGLAILLTGAAGLATILGSVLVLFFRRPGKRFMAASLGFAAGVMIHVSFVDLLPFLSHTVLGAMLCVVAGLMVYISLDELLPTSRAYGHEHLSIAGVGIGMVVMALSLGLMR